MIQRSGNMGSKSAEFIEGSNSIVPLNRSLTQKDSIVAYAKEAVIQTQAILRKNAEFLKKNAYVHVPH